jgi:lipoyl(octanoyl) transferase
VLTEERRAGMIPDTLLLLEHPPTITLGRGADRAHVLASADQLDEQGIERVDTDRGGDVTYHGPGQLVGYPILDLQQPPHRPDLHGYLRRLEETLIRALGECGIAGDRFSTYTGVWIVPPAAPPKKIAAIGIRISRWITRHGFALNVCPNLEHFASIVPCGIHDYGVTSMSRVLGRSVTVSEVTPAVIQAFAEVFDLEPEYCSDCRAPAVR